MVRQDEVAGLLRVVSVAAFVLADGIVAMTDASTTRRAPSPSNPEPIVDHADRVTDRRAVAACVVDDLVVDLGVGANGVSRSR